jgi:acetyltransferase-like isoleucine patch superfamily enzyme
MMEPEDELAAALRSLYERQDEELRDRWDRSLPFQDGLIDRWQRADRLGFGTGASIYNSAIVMGSVAVGPSSWIGPYVLLDGTGGGVDIGAFCSISAGVHVYTHDTVLWSVTMGQADRHTGSVSIGSGCHVGAQTIVGPGVRIGDRSVIGANSFVNRSIPSHSIAVGSPARVVGRVEVDDNGARLVVGPDETAR